MTEIEIWEQEAINAAVGYRWQEAIKLNKKILSKEKKNLSALLRLAYSYIQTNNLVKAKKIYEQVLKIQPTNTIAKENIERIKILQTKKTKKTNTAKIFFDPNLFLESPGKTKSIRLVNLGQKNLLAQLMVGQEVFLKVKNRKVDIRTAAGDYIGSLPDDLAKRLRLFIKAGSEYVAYIKESAINNIVVFIKEIKKGKKVANFISFPGDLSININKLTDEIEEETEEDLSEFDLEKIAENLTTEDKETLPYDQEETEEE
jgi:tetratricopeptide (TPR) repeat protein